MMANRFAITWNICTDCSKNKDEAQTKCLLAPQSSTLALNVALPLGCALAW